MLPLSSECFAERYPLIFASQPWDKVEVIERMTFKRVFCQREEGNIGFLKQRLGLFPDSIGEAPKEFQQNLLGLEQMVLATEKTGESFNPVMKKIGRYAPAQNA